MVYRAKSDPSTIWESTDRLAKIINDDCYKVLQSMESKSIDLILTDPPYGIGADKGVGGFGSSPKTAKHYKDNWDYKPDKKVFDEILRVSKRAIIFGGNFLYDLLPPSTGHWIVWDKVGSFNFKNPYSNCELAWSNIDKKSVKKYIYIKQGFIRGWIGTGGKLVRDKEILLHPTQKPVWLFKEILKDYLSAGEIVLDPFLGSGTTCLAAKILGFKSIGIEFSKNYYQIAISRYRSLLTTVKEFLKRILRIIEG
jgi:site-specific DNA-methyltransferase (adenine-specific)